MIGIPSPRKHGTLYGVIFDGNARIKAIELVWLNRYTNSRISRDNAVPHNSSCYATLQVDPYRTAVYQCINFWHTGWRNTDYSDLFPAVQFATGWLHRTFIDGVATLPKTMHISEKRHLKFLQHS